MTFLSHDNKINTNVAFETKEEQNKELHKQKLMVPSNGVVFTLFTRNVHMNASLMCIYDVVSCIFLKAPSK